MRFLIYALIFCGVARADDPKYEYKDPAKSLPDYKKPTVWKANLTLGLVYIDGNARSVGFSATGLASVKHWNNEFAINIGGALVYSGISQYGDGGPVDSGMKQTAGNYLIRLRYDRYFLEKNTVFAFFQATGNEFAGYLYRQEGQIGYSRLFFQSARQTFKGEIGYDYMHEYRVQPASCTERPCRVFDYHNARLFLFYENKFTPYASFSEGLEMLEAFNRPEAFRLNSLTSLSSTISKYVALKINFKLMFNNDPPTRPAPTGIDRATMMPFVYTPDQAKFGKVDTQLDIVLAVTIL